VRFTDVEPDFSQLAEVLKSYGRPEIMVPVGSMRFGHNVPWACNVRLIFDDHAPTLTPLEWKTNVLERLDVLFSDLRSIGWEVNDDVSLYFRFVYERPRIVGNNYKPKLGKRAKEMCTHAEAEFHLIPIWGELLDG
jgi:hypothetical protein